MRDMIGYCGLDCEKCDAYLATIHDDQALREKTAELWAKLNDAPIPRVPSRQFHIGRAPDSRRRSPCPFSARTGGWRKGSHNIPFWLRPHGSPHS